MRSNAGSESDPEYWDPETETLPRERLRELQLERLRATLSRSMAGQPLIAARLAEAGVARPEDVASDEDLARLPFTAKADLRAAYPYGLLAVPREELVRLQASSGSHGKPTVVGYTRADLDTWAELMARSLTMCGVRPGMLLHNANGYGLFTGGLGFHQGGERIGATVIPVSGGFTARQAMLLRDLGGQALCATPSYALVIAQALREAGATPEDNRLQVALLGGEPWTEAMRTQIESALGLAALALYGLSEMCGPGVASECRAVRDGLHVQEDHFLVEVVDPETGTPVPEGAEGELVFTTLTKEAMPLIRYRTGDLGSVTTERCACGRTQARLHGLRGRLDDMLIVRGVNLYPSTVEQVLLAVPEVAPHYRLVVDRPGALDEITVECEPRDDASVDRASLGEHVGRVLQQQLGLRFTVSVGDPGSVERSAGKAVRVVDRR